MAVLKRIGWLFVNLSQLLLASAWTGLGIPLTLAVQWVCRRPDLALTVARKPFAPVMIAILLARLEVTYRAHPDPNEAYVYVCNHQSYADIPALFIALPAPLRFVAKSSLFKLPILGWFLRATRMIEVHPGSPAKARSSLEAAAKRVRDGASVLAFPEGHRTDDGLIAPFKKGPFKLALIAGASIIPVAIEGAGVAVEPHRFRGRPTRIRVCVGAPIETGDLSPEDTNRLAEQVQQEVVRLHRSIGGAGARPGDPASDAPSQHQLA